MLLKIRNSHHDTADGLGRFRSLSQQDAWSDDDVRSIVTITAADVNEATLEQLITFGAKITGHDFRKNLLLRDQTIVRLLIVHLLLVKHTQDFVVDLRHLLAGRLAELFEFKDGSVLIIVKFLVLRIVDHAARGGCSELDLDFDGIESPHFVGDGAVARVGILVLDSEVFMAIIEHVVEIPSLGDLAVEAILVLAED